MGTILEGVLFYIPANIAHVSFKLKVTGNDLADVFGDTIGNGIITDDTTQLPSDYISRFKIITVGTSATKAISSLLKDHLTHRHTPLDGSLPLLHRFLVGLVTPGGPGTLHVGTSGFPAFGESNWIDDDHTQYLHRGGSTLSDIPNGRDSNDNYIWRNLVVSNPNNKVSGLLLTAVTNGIGALKPLTDPVDIAIQNFAGTSSVLISISSGT